MDRLVTQFCKMLDDLARRHPDGAFDAVFFGMVFLGGAGRYPTEGKLPPPPPGVKDRRKMIEEFGYHTAEQLCDRVRVLVDDQWLHEEFLVVALIQAIEKRFDDNLEGYGAGRVKARNMRDFFQELVNDPAKLATWNSRPERESEPLSAVDAQAMADLGHQMGRATITDLREQRELRDLWRELTAPILSTANLEAFRDQQLADGSV